MKEYQSEGKNGIDDGERTTDSPAYPMGLM